MTTPFEISDRFTEAWADHDPTYATVQGIGGRNALTTDFSPEGHASRNDLYVTTRDDLRAAGNHDDSRQRFAAKVMTGWLDGRIANYEKGKWSRDLNHIYGPFQEIRDVFDVMPRETAEHWDNICARLNGFGGALAGYRQSLEVGLDSQDTVARRQVESMVSQVEAAASDTSRFTVFVDQAAMAGVDVDSVSLAVDAARASCAEFVDWLRATYLPAARESDAVGRERYVDGADHFLGMNIDLDETYDWGWSEVHRIRSEMTTTAAEIDQSMSVEEVIELLETDPARSAGTRAEFVDFISGIQAEAVEQLSGAHFDVPDEISTVTVNMAPPGGSLGAWYVGPSEDFTRAGSIWYAPGERARLPYWQEVSTAYHEGFPGHHLQVGTAVLQREQLSRFHRTVVWYSGAGEGWALYAERLMDELGYFEKPEYRLGLLASQLFRSVRVVVDIGCQLEKRIPDDAPLHAGDIWGYERAVDYMNNVGLQARDVAESEVKRYLGWWGQAISYKVGEREILKMRDDVMSRDGDRYTRKDFHRQVLEAGAIRLDHLREELF